MVSYDWINGGSLGIFFRQVWFLWGELVLFLGMVMKLKDKIVLQGCREGYCEYGHTIRVCVGCMMF